jgi:hypothetical protein
VFGGFSKDGQEESISYIAETPLVNPHLAEVRELVHEQCAEF